jgi:hypothetical protein
MLIKIDYVLDLKNLHNETISYKFREISRNVPYWYLKKFT